MYYHPKTVIEDYRQRAAEWEEIAKSRPQPPSTSAVEAAETHAEQFSDSINEAGDASEQQIAYSSYIAGYAALEERLADAEASLAFYAEGNGAYDEDKDYVIAPSDIHSGLMMSGLRARAYFAKHPSPARGEDKV